MNLDTFVILLLFMDNGPQLDAREVFSSRSNWTEAMVFCLENGGRPAAYTDLSRRKGHEINRKQVVWTGDYGVLPANTHNTNNSEWPDMKYFEYGYTIIHISGVKSIGRSWEANLKKYAGNCTSTGEQYFDSCASRRPFICSGKSYPVIYLTEQTQSEAKTYCLHKNTTLEENISFTEQFATIFSSEDQLQQSFEVWTNKERLLYLRTVTDYLDDEQIEKVGVYDGSFRFIDSRRVTKLKSICLFDDDSYRPSVYPNGKKEDDGSRALLYPIGDEEAGGSKALLYPNGHKRFTRWIQIFVPPACMIFVAVLSSLVACSLVRRQRQEEISPPLAGFEKPKNGHRMTEVVYASASNDAEPTGVEIVSRDHTAELGQVAKQFANEVYMTADVTNHVEIRDDIPNSAEDNVYDNKDFATLGSQQQTINLYDRAIFQDGEPIYD